MGQLDSIIFGDKKFSDILHEIYENQTKKKQQISALISELKPLIQEIGDATLIVPLIKEYLEISVKNDEQLIKMATIIQRAVQNINDDGELGITEEEKAELLSEIEMDFPNCIAINYDYRDLTDHKGKIVSKNEDIEDYGYASEEWEDSVRIDQFFPNIETGEE